VRASCIRARHDPDRQPNGRFSAGNHFGQGHIVDDFVKLARELCNKHKLLQEACKMATGKSPYAKVDAMSRLKAIEFVCGYAYGKPRQSLEVTPGELVLQKRLIWIDEKGREIESPV
jgi:hypothetical protein